MFKKMKQLNKLKAMTCCFFYFLLSDITQSSKYFATYQAQK